MITLPSWDECQKKVINREDLNFLESLVFSCCWDPRDIRTKNLQAALNEAYEMGRLKSELYHQTMFGICAGNRSTTFETAEIQNPNSWEAK